MKQATLPSAEHSNVVADTGVYTYVNYRKADRVAYITLNRPEVLNAMNQQMHAELKRVWDDFEREDDVWVGVLTGAGQRAFSVGQDLKELVENNQSGVETGSFGSFGKPGWPRLTERFNLTKPIIARVNGDALGGGFELALACDIIVAAENVSFALPEVKLGLIAGAGGLFRLTRHIPFKVAMGHLLTGRSIDARRAYELGLVNDVVPPGELDVRVDLWVQDILKCAPLAVRAVKQVAAAASHLSLEDAFSGRYEAEELRRISKDCKEGPLAFVQKRSPNWANE